MLNPAYLDAIRFAVLAPHLPMGIATTLAARFSTISLQQIAGCITIIAWTYNKEA